MRRTIVLLAAVIVLAPACANGDGDTSRTTSRSPGAATPAQETFTPSGDRTPAPDGTVDDGSVTPAPGGSSGDGGSTATAAPPSTAPEGRVNRPPTGRYVYDLAGTQNNPFTVGDEPYPDDAQVLVDVTKDGDEYTARSQSSEDATTTTTKTTWESARVLLTYLRVDIPNVANFQCNITPPVEILHVPVKAETFAEQSFANDVDKCSGTVEIQVMGREDVTDAAGRTWSAWKVHNKTTYSFDGGFEGTLEGDAWFSPDLGTAVKTDERNDGRFSGGDFRSDQVSLLRTHP